MVDREDQAVYPAWRVVSVPVATVWTSPSSPRSLDAPALAGFALGRPGSGPGERGEDKSDSGNSVKKQTDSGFLTQKRTGPGERWEQGIEAWLGAMTVPDKLDLCEANRVQTQALYGTPVLTYEEQDGWSRIAIPSQSSPKDENGYPGWIPTEQLLPISAQEAHRLSGQEGGASDGAAVPNAIVTASTTDLEFLSYSGKMRISFLTRLPLATEEEQGTVLGAESVIVQTPHGLARMKRADVQVAAGDGGSPADDVGGRNKGQVIVAQAKRFLGLHYLWGGMSAWGYDCSGFAHSMHLACGIVIPRDASVQALHGAGIPPEELQPGDLLFFAHEQGQGRVHHVGIYAGDGHMIHSPDSASSVELISLEGYKLADEHCVSRRYWT
ncbi:NlpC/P60 family protein [Paenibacillus sp. XY044]|uniref:C40 family peptidase n=1 Tax=Paenibacillus sp. XY044 TaxID=2026089 RepID=UPI0015C65AAD|nr:NlpC/P60 family protein [Paenibacillus sp. XY044]